MQPQSKGDPVLYLHGFASGPGSTKARFFHNRIPNLEIPDLAQGDFERLTISGQFGVIEHAASGRPSILIGSSLGGYLAALYASRHAEVTKLILLAPAFGFARRWARSASTEDWRRNGFIEVFHYGDGRMRRLNYSFLEDALRYEDFPDFKQPALIFHGTRDDVVPPEASAQFAASHANTHVTMLDSDHQLTDALDAIWRETEPFLLG
jgi:pimeloyl-ACP methyl ester carboxylesterase